MSSVFVVQRRHLAWGVALIMLLSAMWIVRSDVADAGGTPPGEGIAIVYVSGGSNFPDALGVGPGAGASGAPVIIVPVNPPIGTMTMNELVRLDPRTVIIVGGTSVVSTAMEDALEALLPNAGFSRIAGANRYDTNAGFSAATFPIEGWASISGPAFTGGQPATEVVGVNLSAYNSSTGTLLAPIQLPHGAEILELKAGIYDDGADNVQVVLYRTDVAALQTQIAIDSTSGFTAGYTTLSDTAIVDAGAIVDNELYSYYVVVTGVTGSSSYLLTAMVRYRLGVSTG